MSTIRALFTPITRISLLGLALPLFACGGGGNKAEAGSGTDEVGTAGDTTTQGESSSSGSSSSSDTTLDTTTTASDTATDTTASDTTTDTSAAECGNGAVEDPEQCDNGVDNGPTNDCLADCSFNVCGDTFVGPIEGCDDGNLIDGDGCSAMCLIENPGDGVVMCGNKIYQCGDGIDNDGDNEIDLADPECISPCDDDENSFQTNLPGQNNDCKGDCYFDSNSGAGDDHCEWNLKCDPLNPGADIGCAYDPNFAMCDLEMPQVCLDFCTPLVPNGCDCFGCCEVDGQFIYLDSGDGCSLDNLDACQSCTFFEGCNNPCVPAECELCFGQTPEDLPPGCDMSSCPMGVTPCDNISDCAVGEFCQTGCCVDIQPQ